MNRDGFFFDERFFHYASDCDIALRIAGCGIRGIQLDIQYYHYGSASHRSGTNDEKRESGFRADWDRSLFEDKWGFKVDALEYGQKAFDINFRGEEVAK